MNLDSALSIATGGLANVSRQMALISHNVANASTPAYSVENPTQKSMTANGEGLGVRSGPAVRSTDAMLQAEVFSQNATVAGMQTRQPALQAIAAVQGVPGQGGDLASLLGALQDQFSILLNDPSSQAQQNQVVSAAATLARGINTTSDACTAQRQAAQDGIVSEIGSLNAALGTIGGLSTKIITLKSEGQSTADLENQRDAAVQTVSQLLDVKVLEQPNGDVLLTTSSGLILPIHGANNPLSTSGANMLPGTWYPVGGVPAIMLGGTDVTSQLQGGQIGANIVLRDTTLPTYQAELDEFAQNLSTRFSGQGLKLFIDPTGDAAAGPQNGYVGYAGVVQVDPAVLANPSLVRDGNPSVNLPPPPQPPYAGFSDIINAVLNNVFGSVPPLTTKVSQLGPAGNLNAPYVVPSTLGQLAATVVATQAQDSAANKSQLGIEQAIQTNLTTKLSDETGVNMDTEMASMIQLQNAYGANAKIITAVQSMWTQLMNSVR